MHLREAAATSYQDLSSHPWAGLPVEIRLTATDALGQTGESAPVQMKLPERVFRNPVAQAIIDQRKELARDTASAPAVAEILDDLNSRPAIYGDDAVVYLALHLTAQQLRQSPDKPLIANIEQLLWDTALRIEDGHMSVAERDLRRLQQQLQDALAKNAPDAEIENWMQELREAMDRYMQALAQEYDSIRAPNAADRSVKGADQPRPATHARQGPRPGPQRCPPHARPARCCRNCRTCWKTCAPRSPARCSNSGKAPTRRSR